MYVRKEAVLSSQIEVTQSTLSDLLLFETEAEAGTPIDDIREVSNYVDAIMYGIERMKDLPISLRLIRELHERLMKGSRGSTKSLGEFRTSQNWIGGTRPGNAIYVLPPVTKLNSCLDALEKFIHAETPGLPLLIKAGLLHVQFESIHPFLDGITQTADQAFDSAIRIAERFKVDREHIASAGDRAGSILRLHELLQINPHLTASAAVKRSGLTMPTVDSALAELERLGVVNEITGRKRGRAFCYKAFLDILNEAP